MGYTKGPWHVTKEFRTRKYIYDSGGRLVVEVNDDRDEYLANAQLIAAAPNGLIAGIDAYVALLRTPIGFRLTIQSELCQLRDFIAKATQCDSEDIQNKYEAQAIAEVEK